MILVQSKYTFWSDQIFPILVNLAQTNIYQDYNEIQIFGPLVMLGKIKKKEDLWDFFKGVKRNCQPTICVPSNYSLTTNSGGVVENTNNCTVFLKAKKV